jgi:NAD-dependent DNA ligase
MHLYYNQEDPEKTDDNYDQRWKIRTILNKLNDSMVHLTDKRNM